MVKDHALACNVIRCGWNVKQSWLVLEIEPLRTLFIDFYLRSWELLRYNSSSFARAWYSRSVLMLRLILYGHRMVLKDSSSLWVRKVSVVITRALWVAPVKSPCLLTWLAACLALVTAALVVRVAVVWWKEALRCLILACKVTDTCLRLVAVVVSVHYLKAATAMSAIHWWTFDWHRLGASLLMRIDGLLLDLVLMHCLRFLPTASKVATSICKHLIIGEDITGCVTNLRLGNLVDCASRWSHWIRMHHNCWLVHRWR